MPAWELGHQSLVHSTARWTQVNVVAVDWDKLRAHFSEASYNALGDMLSRLRATQCFPVDGILR